MKWFIIVSTLSLAFFFVNPVSAESPAASPSTKNTKALEKKATGLERKAEQVAAKAEDQLAKLKERAKKEIDRRLERLTKLIKKIIEVKKLSGQQRTALTNEVQAEITALTNLKTKIEADTDLETTKADIKSIVSEYRVFLFFVPKIHLLASATMLDQTADKLAAIADKLDVQIKAAQAAGKDVSPLQTTLADMRGKITDAKTQVDLVNSTVIPLTASGYPGNKGTLEAAYAALKTGRADLREAHKDAKTILEGLKGSSPSPGASPSATASP